MWVKEEGAKDDYFNFDLNRLDSEVIWQKPEGTGRVIQLP